MDTIITSILQFGELRLRTLLEVVHLERCSNDLNPGLSHSKEQ